MFKFILKKLKNILPHKIYDNFHYGKFLGSFNFLRIISWNLFHPNRILNRILWNTLFLNKKKKIKEFNLKSEISKNKISLEKLDFFIENGGVLLNNFFSEKEIDEFLYEYKNLLITHKEKINQITGNEITIYKPIKLYLSKPLLDIWLNSDVVEFVKSFLGTEKIYAREYPRLIYTKYIYKNSITSKDDFNGVYKNLIINGPYFWHVDHTAGLVNFHVLLQDVNEISSAHMQFLSGSNKYFNSRDAYSDESVNNFKNKPINCVGKKGTIYFHQGNTLHRVVGRCNSERLGLIFSFSKGASIEFDPDHILSLMENKYDLGTLSKEKREILNGIIPKKRMIEIKNDKINSPKIGESIK